MSWLLHVSDPHLGGTVSNDDEKVILTQRDLETTQTVFQSTLRKLGRFIEQHDKPSVVVVSGDLTYQTSDDGFNAFITLLAERGDVLPDDKSNVVVVPGNHDVDWGKDPGVEERYEGFLRATRAEGCSTPLLDGVDFEADDLSGRLFDHAKAEPHVVRDQDVLVIPINSSNYCGSLAQDRDGWNTDEWDAALAPLGPDAEQVFKEVQRLRHFDMARVSRPQVAALGQLFEHLGEPQHREPDDRRVRIAVLHHHLLPVTEREERKPFESLVNLGLVRNTLREYAVDLVLHGHKHESGLYWDVVGAEEGSLDTSLQRMLVISSPGHFKVGTPVMRALRLTGTPRARSMSISTFLGPSVRRNFAQVEDTQPNVPLWLGAMEAESTETNRIQARSAHVAYARLRGVFETREPDQPMRNLVCQVDDPSDAQTLPPDYPGEGAARTQAWFDDLVDWWQLDRSELVDRRLVGFNHGERIYRRWGDQVERAARMLDQRADSSRALIELVAPRETGRYHGDERELYLGSFPAFTLAEFGITKRRNRRYLDCFGYFRKQELQYWWPVNLAELARIQSDVLSRMRTPKPRVGRIVTFSAIALWADTLPRVAVPEIDRLIDTRDGLWSLAAALNDPDRASPSVKAEWFRVLDDLAGVGRDRPPQPKLGLRRLLNELDRAAALGPLADVGDARAALVALEEQHAAAADGELNSTARELVLRELERLRAAVIAALGDPDPPL
jgi:3',5'-cyclic AMP phosphodiesterase CpdA